MEGNIVQDTLAVGATHSSSITVTADLAVPSLPSAMGEFATMPAVFATPMVVAFVEATCVGLLHPHLDPGEVSLGIHVEVSHDAATPLGGAVTATVTVARIGGRTVEFSAEVIDDVGIISQGTHRRAIVDEQRFLAGLAAHPAAG